MQLRRPALVTLFFIFSTDFMKKLSSFIVLISLLSSYGIAFADTVANEIDATVDATVEVLDMTAGGPAATVSFIVKPITGDGDSGCNLDAAGENATFNVLSDDTSVAFSDQATITFTGPGCNDAPSITVHANNVGIAHFTLTPGTNSTGGSFDLTSASFDINVGVPVPTDTSAPAISATVTPASNANGWNNSAVTVVWTVNDPESPYLTTGCETTVLADETVGTTLTCSATSAGGIDSQSVTVKIDMTKPVVSGAASSAPNGNGWYKEPVTVNFSCTETGAVQSGIETDDVEDVTLSTEGAGQTVTNTGSCIDAAGNAADQVSVSGLNLDMTAPEIFIATPALNGSYTFNQTYFTNWSATDALSGINAGSLTPASGLPLATATLGATIFSVSASDLAGNSNTASQTYQVIGYDFTKCALPPILDSKDFKKSSTVPVKCPVLNTLGQAISNANLTLFVDGNPATPSGNSNTGNQFRYSSGDQFYIYNLSTKPLTVGPHIFRVHGNDGSDKSIAVTVK
jgi:hypothetical protein